MHKQLHIEWVTAYTTQNLSEAYSMAGRLKKAGIAHFIKPDSLGHVYDLRGDNRGEVEVLVTEVDYEQATEVLREINPLPRKRPKGGFAQGGSQS